MSVREEILVVVDKELMKTTSAVHDSKEYEKATLLTFLFIFIFFEICHLRNVCLS